jgi:hypothetical protein
MNASPAMTDSLLRRASIRLSRRADGELAAQILDMLFRVCFGPSRLEAPASGRDSSIS